MWSTAKKGGKGWGQAPPSALPGISPTRGEIGCHDRLSDYKEKVIARVTRVSVETVAITEAMKQVRR